MDQKLDPRDSHLIQTTCCDRFQPSLIQPAHSQPEIRIFMVDTLRDVPVERGGDVDLSFHHRLRRPSSDPHLARCRTVRGLYLG